MIVKRTHNRHRYADRPTKNKRWTNLYEERMIIRGTEMYNICLVDNQTNRRTSHVGRKANDRQQQQT